MALRPESSTEVMSSVLQIINSMMLDMLATIARKDYEVRRNRQMQGIASAQAKGKYAGSKLDYETRKIISSVLKAGYSCSDFNMLPSANCQCRQKYNELLIYL